jgi:hypothetical protein
MLNADGEFMRLANEAEVAPKLQAMLGTVVQELSTRLPTEQRAAFQQMIQQVLSPAALISSSTREAQIYFGLNGAALGAGESIEAGIEQPGPAGGKLIPAIFRVRVDSAAADSAALSSTTTYDRDALRDMTIALLEQSGAPIPAEKMATIPPMQMSDDGEYTYDRKLGLMREVLINRRISAANEHRLDGWRIRLVTPPKR